MSGRSGAAPVVVLGTRSELGRALAAALPDDARGRHVAPVVIDITLQRPNTLLHDGRAWWRDAPRHVLASTRRALTTARTRDSPFLVHASWAFLANAEQGGRVGDTLRPIVDAGLEAEAMVRESGIPACVLRLGYLYGPGYRDLRAYRTAFHLRRPYWAGPRRALQHHLHADDASRALLAAARSRPAGRLLHATDGEPAPFADFMDHFAHLVGRQHPLHIPAAARLLVRPVVRQAHVEMTELGAPGPARPRLPGWRPEHAGYRSGLAAVVAAWARR